MLIRAGFTMKTDNPIVKLESIVIPIYDHFDRHIYKGHILRVRYFSVRLARELGSDVLLCDLAGLLHDIGLAIYGGNKHNISGSRKSKELLRQTEIEEKNIELIAKIIRNHNESYSPRFTLEDEILRSADGMAHISEMPFIFYSFLFQNDYEEAKVKTKNKLLFDMEQKITIPLAKNIISKEYESAVNLLDGEGF